MSDDESALGRRDFLRHAGVMGLGVAVSNRLPSPLVRSPRSANEKVVVAVFGLNGRGMVHVVGSPEFEALAPEFPDLPGRRSIIDVAVTRVTTSCGFAVPLMDLVDDRDRLLDWAKSKAAVRSLPGAIFRAPSGSWWMRCRPSPRRCETLLTIRLPITPAPSGSSIATLEAHRSPTPPSSPRTSV